jgi:hypothetical protein
LLHLIPLIVNDLIDIQNLWILGLMRVLIAGIHL